MTRAECIQKLTEDYRNRRKRDEELAEERLLEVAGIEPEIVRLRQENAMLAINTIKRISMMTDDKQRRAAATEMREQGIANNNRMTELLLRAGFAPDYLKVKYECDICKDTGLVGDAPSRFCDCFERAIRLLQYEDGSMGAVSEECFERFDITRIPDIPGQREQAEAVRNICEEYADSFPNTRFKNLVLTGAGGLGKTFMLNSIYARAVSRGQEAIRITAYRLFEAMRRKMFSDSGEQQEFDALLRVPLLLIDDLGTEPMMRNITIESMFILFNERAQTGRHTVVSTNLSPIQIQERYGERVMSRMFDRTRSAALLLKGKDIRKQ